MKRLCTLVAAIGAAAALSAQAPARSDRYLAWTPKEADAIGQQGYKRGRVGGIFDTRLLKTERSYNYKLAATWLTPEVIRASARLAQLGSRLSDEETQQMVIRAEGVADTVVMVEIDPREGSGVIPLDWEAFLEPRNAPERAVRGKNAPELRNMPALAGVLRRNYDYDRFWMTFPLRAADGQPLFRDADTEAELVVRIHDKEGRVSWPIPRSVREQRPHT